jgi:hypothetical protein
VSDVPRPDASVSMIFFSVSSRAIGRSRRLAQTPCRNVTTASGVPWVRKLVVVTPVVPL